MHFASDNWAGAHPAVAEALVRNAGGFAAAYGTSELDRRVEQKFCEIFERDVAVFFVATGTAANSLSIAAMARPGGIAFMHRESHMIEDECGAPEYLANGCRLHPVDGTGGRIDPTLLDRSIRRYPPAFVHSGQPVAVSITQATEVGTVYSLDQIREIAAISSAHGLPLHMDGARFANALAALDCTPAEMTWKSGVKLLSFGGTKNGCWCAEAIVVFDDDLGPDFPFLRKRAAQLFSKTRFVAAQFDAYFEDGLWLKSARHANAMAASLAAAFDAAPGVRLAWQPEANELFALAGKDTLSRLREAGAVFYDWHAPQGFSDQRDDETMIRLVTSFATREEEVDAFAALLRG